MVVFAAAKAKAKKKPMMKKKNMSRPKQGGIRRQPGASNIKPLKSAKGIGPAHRGPGFGKSLPTHVRMKSGAKGTFAT